MFNIAVRIAAVRGEAPAALGIDGLDVNASRGIGRAGKPGLGRLETRRAPRRQQEANIVTTIIRMRLAARPRLRFLVRENHVGRHGCAFQR
jgi:hypothetical protein